MLNSRSSDCSEPAIRLTHCSGDHDDLGEQQMRLLTLALTAAAIGLVAPWSAPANAQDPKVTIRVGDRDHARDHRWRRDRHEGRWWHHRDRERVVIIKKRHRDRY
jgi:hypothetical protein